MIPLFQNLPLGIRACYGMKQSINQSCTKTLRTQSLLDEIQKHCQSCTRIMNAERVPLQRITASRGTHFARAYCGLNLEDRWFGAICWIVDQALRLLMWKPKLWLLSSLQRLRRCRSFLSKNLEWRRDFLSLSQQTRNQTCRTSKVPGRASQ